MTPNISDELNEANNNDLQAKNQNFHHRNSTKNINIDTKAEETKLSSTNDIAFKPQIRWPDLLAQIGIHLGFLYGLYYLVTFQAKFYTYLWCKLKHFSLAVHEKK